MKVLLFIILLESLLFGNNIVRITNGEYKPFQSKDLLNYGFVSEIVSDYKLLLSVKIQLNKRIHFIFYNFKITFEKYWKK